jgi:ribosomal protein S18 acetylase RimI-like enzyme
MAETGAPQPGAPGPPLRIRAALPSEAADAARLHAEGIDQGFLSLLGPRFLGRLYRRITLDPGSFLIVATGYDRVLGFVAGSVDVPSLYRSFLRRDGVVAGLPALGRVLVHWRRVLETLRHGSSDGAGAGPGAELLAIAVDRSARGQGAGRSLVDAFVDELTLRGVDAAHVVVGADNGAAVGLYRRSGFEVVERFELHPGTESLLMAWQRSGRAAPAEPPGPTAS